MQNTRLLVLLVVGLLLALLIPAAEAGKVAASVVLEKAANGLQKNLATVIQDQAKATNASNDARNYASRFADPEQLKQVLPGLLQAEQTASIVLSNDVRTTVLVLYLFKEERFVKTLSVADVRNEFLAKAFREACTYLRDEGEMTKSGLPIVINKAFGGFGGDSIEPKPNKYGRVKVSSNPDSSDVLFNDEYTGATNDTFVAAVGKLKVCVRQPGFDDCIRDIEVQAGKTVPVDCPLQKGAQRKP